MADPTSRLRQSPDAVDITPHTETDQNGPLLDPTRHADVTARSQAIGSDGAGPGTAVNRGL